MFDLSALCQTLGAGATGNIDSQPDRLYVKLEVTGGSPAKADLVDGGWFGGGADAEAFVHQAGHFGAVDCFVLEQRGGD